MTHCISELLEVPIDLAHPDHLPAYATHEAAGADLKAFITEPVILEPGESKLIPTGFKMALPEGYEAQVRPRSGLALKHGITVLNTPGTIDSDYRGEVCVILINHSKQPFTVVPSMRIAQLVIAPVVRAHFKPAKNLATSTRNTGGFGHTGC